MTLAVFPSFPQETCKYVIKDVFGHVLVWKFTTLMTKRANPVTGFDLETETGKIIPYSTFKLSGSWSHNILLQGGEQAEGAGTPGAEAGGGGGQASQAHRHALDHVASHVTPRHPCHVLSAASVTVFLCRNHYFRGSHLISGGYKSEPSSQTRFRPRGESRDSPSCAFRGLCNKGLLVQKSLAQGHIWLLAWSKGIKRERFNDHKWSLISCREAQHQSYSFSHSSCRVDRWEKKSRVNFNSFFRLFSED